MKNLLSLFGLSALLLTGLFAQTADERAAATAYLKKTEAGVLEGAKGLSAAQLNFKQAPDRWSVAEVLEHIASAEDFLMDMVHGQVMTAPARPPGDDVKAIDAMVQTMLTDRSHKLQAPEPLKPNNRYGSAADSLKHFEASRAATIKFLNDTKDLRDHAIDSPLGKKLDGYEWVLFIAAHSERHTKQLLEVKADPNFPKS